MVEHGAKGAGRIGHFCCLVRLVHEAPLVPEFLLPPSLSATVTQ
jgi:hypothetical protein